MAAAVHRAWCAHTIEEGRRPGDRHDEDRKLNPALGEFAAVGEQARRQLTNYVADHLDLSDAVSYADLLLGRPEWTTADVEPGSRVRFWDDTPPREVGVIESLELIPSKPGAISLIWVRWPDGILADYTPGERALARA